MTEREKIVAWLDRWANGVDFDKGALLNHIARRIERGDYLIRPEPTIPASEWKNSPSVGH